MNNPARQEAAVSASAALPVSSSHVQDLTLFTSSFPLRNAPNEHTDKSASMRVGPMDPCITPQATHKTQDTAAAAQAATGTYNLTIACFPFHEQPKKTRQNRVFSPNKKKR
jgi:hypothetical protein